MVVKTKGKKRSKKYRGGNSYHGARKKRKGSGHKGGVGMAGTGKRADHKKSLVIKLYGNRYFGKKGITSKKTERTKLKSINLNDISKNFESLSNKYSKNNELVLKDYKILGEGELKFKIVIKARAFSKSAEEKIKKAGGEAIVFTIKKEGGKKAVQKDNIKKSEGKQKSK